MVEATRAADDDVDADEDDEDEERPIMGESLKNLRKKVVDPWYVFLLEIEGAKVKIEARNINFLVFLERREIDLEKKRRKN